MAYYTGQASSYQELLNILVSACQNHGWVWASGYLKKHECSFNLTIPTVQGVLAGITIQGVVSQSTSPVRCRIGPMGDNPSHVPDLVFPVNYHLHIFEDADEVYLIVNYDIDRYQYLAFGADAQIKWYAASISWNYIKSTNINDKGIWIDEGGGSSNSISNRPASSGLIWQAACVHYDQATHAVYSNIDNLGWMYPKSPALSLATISAARAVQGLIENEPSAWSSSSLLLPVSLIGVTNSNKSILFKELENSRYLRIDNYAAEQILKVADSKFKIYPFHKKNLTKRGGGNMIDHTGTFGFAVRHDDF